MISFSCVQLLKHILSIVQVMLQFTKACMTEHENHVRFLSDSISGTFATYLEVNTAFCHFLLDNVHASRQYVSHLLA